MAFLKLLFGIIAAFFIGVLFVDIPPPPAEMAVESPAPAATSTPTKAVATSTQTIPSPAPPKKPAAAPAKTETVAPSGPQPTIPLDTSSAALRSALVNILCYVLSGSGLHSISGSGVFVDPKGIILTNAHIADYFLLADRNVTCTIRTGSPARNAYTAELAFISSRWIYANPSVLTDEAPTGTGEYDFAFLAVTKSITTNPLPDSFPYITLSIEAPVSGSGVVIGSYAAQFLASNQVESLLSPTLVFGSIKDLYTFKTNTVDVIALGGSVAAQEGSSGGGIVDSSGKLIGTITPAR